jgi:hypothetical protein
VEQDGAVAKEFVDRATCSLPVAVVIDDEDPTLTQ